MKCNIYLKIGEESILIAKEMDSSLIPSEINQDFLNIVKNSGKINLLKDTLEKVLLEGVTEKQIEGVEKGEFGKYQIANTTAKEIAESFPQLSFPNIDLSKVKVRLVDKFKNYGTNIIVKQSANGEDIYLLDGNFTTIKKFARHLAIEDAVNNQVLDKLDKNSEEIKTIDKVLEKAKLKYKDVKDRASLLRHYIRNKSKYSKITIFSEEGNYTAAVLLDSILPKIEQVYYPKNNNYSTPLVKNLHGQGGISYSNGKPQISYGNLYNILSGQLNLSMFKSQKEFNQQMKSSEKTDEIIKFFEQFNIDVTDSTEENYNILFQNIFSKERGYPYSYSYVDKDGIIRFKSNYYSKEGAYGLGYDTIVLLPKTSYKGWNIVEHELNQEDEYGRKTSEYFISQYEMQPTTKGKSYSTLKEAKAAIDKKLQEQSFKSSFFIQLHQNLDKINSFGEVVLSSKSDHLEKGNVIKIPKISLPNNPNIIDPRENIILGNGTIENFKDVVKLWPKESQEILFDEKGNLINEVNNVSKAGVFLTLLNTKYENRERTLEIINDILEQIKKAPSVYFYVEESILDKVPVKDPITKEPKRKDGKVVTRDIRKIRLLRLNGNPETTDDIKQRNGFQYPIISFWEDTAKTLNNIFGTKINILTQSEIEDKFGINYSKEKAFIKGEEVYINSTLGSTEDLFHEYIHIIMGYLKVNNPEIYSSLLKQVWDKTGFEDRRNINILYSKESYVSKLEENFAKQFSKHIYEKGKGKFDQIFNSEPLSEVFDTIFDKSETTIEGLSKMSLSEVFGKFSTEIAMGLQKNDKLFKTFASSEEFRLSNQKTNLLKKWIKEGKIKEFNCR